MPWLSGRMRGTFSIRLNLVADSFADEVLHFSISVLTDLLLQLFPHTPLLDQNLLLLYEVFFYRSTILVYGASSLPHGGRRVAEVNEGVIGKHL